jgi:hypothetical protein
MVRFSSAEANPLINAANIIMDEDSMLIGNFATLYLSAITEQNPVINERHGIEVPPSY